MTIRQPHHFDYGFSFASWKRLSCVFVSVTLRYNLAGFLINIVFSSLFLGTQIPNVRVIWKQAGPQLMYGMLIAWGQWLVALIVTGALLVRSRQTYVQSKWQPKLYFSQDYCGQWHVNFLVPVSPATSCSCSYLSSSYLFVRFQLPNFMQFGRSSRGLGKFRISVY